MDTPTQTSGPELSARATPREVLTLAQLNVQAQKAAQSAALPLQMHAAVSQRGQACLMSHGEEDAPTKFWFISDAEQLAFNAACDHLRVLFTDT